MWTSCCSWLCVETNATTVEGNGNTGRRTYLNSGYNHPTTAPEVLCKACGGCFGTLARKHVCVDCKKSFCSRCSVQLELRPRLCLTCLRFHGTLFDRAALMGLRVRELRDYLHLHGVPTQTCREKEELVELVLCRRTPSSSSSSEAVSQPSSTPPEAAPGPIRLSSSSEAVSQPSSTPPEAAPGPIRLSTPTDPPLSVDLEPHGPGDDQDLSVPVTSSPEETPDHEMDTEVQEEQESQSDTEETTAPGRRASLADIGAAEDIEALSVRQLKEILARNFVSYTGCCEKWELMERVTRLYNNQKGLHDPDSAGPKSQEENLCKICMDSPIDCVLLECGHMVTCSKCGKRMSECPICRQYVVRAVHVFRS